MEAKLILDDNNDPEPSANDVLANCHCRDAKASSNPVATLFYLRQRGTKRLLALAVNMIEG